MTRDSIAEAAASVAKGGRNRSRLCAGPCHLALCHWATVSQGWMDRSDPAVAEMIHLARAALALDSNDPEVLHIAGQIIACPVAT